MRFTAFTTSYESKIWQTLSAKSEAVRKLTDILPWLKVNIVQTLSAQLAG